MNSFNKRFNKFRGTAVGALILASGMTLASSAAMGAIVDSGVVNIPVPQTSAGIYLNFVTNAQGTSAGAVTGWDFNPYMTASGFGTYWNSVTAGGVRGAGVATDGTSNITAVLASGTSISSTSFFTSSIQGPATNWRPGVTNGYMGVRFVNEGTGIINYGWVQLTTTGGGSGSAAGFPATIVRYAYENTGAPITAGTVPVTLQSFGVE